MYACTDCGAIFDAPEIRHEWHHTYMAISEPLECCPECGEAAIEEAVQCEECGEYIGSEQARYGLCPECEQAAERKLAMLLKENFSIVELEYLDTQTDGLHLDEIIRRWYTPTKGD